MHKLQRGASPTCLAKYKHGVDLWSQTLPGSAEKDEIWSELNAMQGRRCAYCETDLSGNNKHIEHFRQRSRFPQGTFDWSNLFGSCNRDSSCGKHKDKSGAYDHLDLIKPDEDDPEKYLVFVSDGTITVRDGLSDHDRRRAVETLRIFNLDAQHGPLRRMRQQAVAGYIHTADEIRLLAEGFSEDEWRPLLENELSVTAHLPFATAIKHVLMP